MPKIQFVALEFLDRASWFEYFFRDLVGNGAAYSDDSNPCLADGCGYCSDGVFIQMIIGHDTESAGLKDQGLRLSGFYLAPCAMCPMPFPFFSLLGDNHNLFKKTITFTLCIQSPIGFERQVNNASFMRV